MIRGDRIRERLTALGRSQGWLGREVALSPQAISKIVSGGTAETPKLFQIARALETTPEYLTGETDDCRTPNTAGNQRSKVPRRPRENQQHTPNSAASLDDDIVAIAEIDLKFGLARETIDKTSEPNLRSFSRAWVRQITASSPEMLYWARGKGNSMEPTIGDGDIILVDRSQQTLDFGDLYWAISFGNVGMVKRLRPMPDGTIKILSDNSSVAPDVAADGALKIFGRVIAVVRKI